MTLDEFAHLAPMTVSAFVEASQEGIDKKVKGFVNEMPEEEWWIEFAAYRAYVEVQEMVAQAQQGREAK